MPFCKNCGSSIEDGAKFCENCGTPIEAPVAQPAAQPAVDPSMLVADEIKKLAALRDQGILTDEEFTEQKRRLLGF